MSKPRLLQRDRRIIRAAMFAPGAALGTSNASQCMAAPPPPGPHVVLDGTLGKAGPIQPTLGNYLITPDLGVQKGGNLFQSFTRLDLTFGESATFTGPTSVQNVIARVTGGAQSNIDGTLRCTIPGANFYFINPAGVVFGSNAQLDVKGSFAVTTAGLIKLADGGQVNAANPSASVLTTAAPAAFGFMTPSAPPITVTGLGPKQPVLAVPAGNVISLVGGPVQLSSGQLSASGGRVNVVAVASAGDVAFDATNLDSAITLPAGGARADISLTNSTISVDGAGGGRVTIRGNNVALQSSTITAQTLGAVNGRGIDIDATGQFSLVGSTLMTADGLTPGVGAGTGSTGSISITAGSVLIDSTSTPTSIATDADTGVGAHPGSILITTSTLQVLDTASNPTNMISAVGDTPGTVTINASAITFNGAAASLQPGVAPGQFQILLPSVGSGIVTDGTLGSPAMTLSGPVFQVESSMGKLVGTNLFQSFSLFNVPTGDTAEFDGPASVTNVIARVTGNSPSQINGTISCTIPGANLFLINPAGLVFGSTSTLNVLASFAATTADFVGFADGGQFNARTPASSVFSGASPVSFGFSSAAPGAISLTGNALAVPMGATLALVGGTVQLQSTQLTAPSGRINLVGVSGAGSVPIALGLDDPLTLPAGLARAPVSLDDAFVDVSGDSGRISIRGSDVVIQDASMLNAPTDTGAGRGVDIDATGLFSLLASTITAGTNGPTASGQGGSVVITAANVVLDGRGNMNPGPVGIITDSTGTGAPGNITVQAASVQVFDGMTFSAMGQPQAGQFKINSPVVTFDGLPAAAVANGDGTFQFGYTQNVVLDSSLGQAGGLTGPNYDIDPSLGIGKVSGSNLFESFSQFSLAFNESLVINGPASVKNVLVRVTGSSPAAIDGTFTVNIPGANLFLMDAAGISVTSNAQLTLGGALVTTSANSILFAGGGRFDAIPSAAPLPSGPTVSSFQFTAFSPAAVALNPGNLNNGSGISASLVGGSLTASSTGSAGLNLVAVASPGQVVFNPADPTSTPDVSAIAKFSDITLTMTANFTSGGPLFIRGNNLTISNSNLTFSQVDIGLTGGMSLLTSTLTATPGGVQISQPGTLHLSTDSRISAGGNINIKAGAVTLDSNGPADAADDSMISAQGDILVNATSLTAGDSVNAQIFSTNVPMSNVPGGLVQIFLNGQPLGGTGSLILDGTLGPSGAITGPDYVLGPGQGSLVGTNLFESFSHFDVAAGELLTLNGPSTVQNVLIRVTGGPAELDGGLRSNIPGARVYLIDPSGITFGTGTNVNLGTTGSFLASTASSVTLGTAGRFDAVTPQSGMLTADAPTALNFGATPAAISLQTTSLTAPALSLIGGSLQITNSNFSAQATNLVTPPANAVISLSSADGVSPTGLSAPSPAWGDITLTNLNSAGYSISARNLTATGGLVQGDISVNAISASFQNFQGDGSVVALAVGGNLSIAGSMFNQNHFVVSAGSMTLDNSTVTMSTQTSGSPNDIQIQSGSLTLQNNASISTNTLEAALGGNIQLTIAGMLSLNSGSSVLTLGGIPSSAPGNAGSIFITAHDLLLNSGTIATISENTGQNGFITISAVNSVSLTGGSQIYSENQDGAAGGMLLTAAQLSIDTSTPLINRIYSRTDGGATAASFTISAPSLSAGIAPTLQIYSTSTSTGSPGVVTINNTQPNPSTIVLDNSLVTATLLTGPNFSIPPSVGTQVGGNLFESFSQFDLAANQSATFTGPGTVTNVLVRVTGGTPAIIDGHLNCTIPGANFFLLDQAGIVIGPNAVLNLASSFAVSTANSIGLSDGGTFSASLTGSTLTAGTPASFMFTGPASPIYVLGYGSNPINGLDPTSSSVPPGLTLQVADRSVFSLIGGNISIQGRAIEVPDGGVNLISTASAGQVPFDPTDPHAGIIPQQFTAFGSVTISNQSTIDVSDGPNDVFMGGGRIAVLANSLTMNSSTLSASTSGGATAGIFILLAGDLSLSNSNLSVPGGYANIGISANNVTLSNSTLSMSQSAGSAEVMYLGGTGSITLYAAGQLSMTSSSIQSTGGVFDANVAGATLVNSSLSAQPDTANRGIAVSPPGIIRLEASGSLSISNSSVSTGTNANANTNSGGSILLTAGSFSLTDGSTIDASVQGLGQGGTITISASGPVVISAASISSSASVGTAAGPGGSNSFTGAVGGDISISGATIQLANGAQLSSTSQGGASGAIILNATNISIAGSTTSIIADTADATIGTFGNVPVPTSSIVPGGMGGDIQVTATGSLQITGATLSAVTTGQGQAGDITLSGAQVSLSGATVSTSSSSAGPAGSVTVTGGALVLSGGSLLSSAATGTGNGGGIDINVSGPVLINGGSMISTNTASTGLAGDVTLDARSLQIVGSSISSSSTGEGNAGSVIVNVQQDVTLSGGAALAATSSESAGGDVKVTAGSFSLLGASTVSTQSQGQGGTVMIHADAGGINVRGESIISAQSAGSGSIELTAVGAIGLTHGFVTAQTPGAGGSVSISSTRSNLIFDNATISAQAGSLGNINLHAANLMLILDHTTITARATTNGGKIQIDPPVIVLDQSIIDGRAGGRDVLVEVADSATFLTSPDSLILSNNLSLPPETDVAAALIALPSTVPQTYLGLAPVCAPRLDADFSSFIVTGQGGRPPQPGGWTPDLFLGDK